MRRLTDIYEPTYATGIDTLLPSTTPIDTLFEDGKLPETALFSSTTPVTGNATLDAALADPRIRFCPRLRRLEPHHE